MPAFSILRCRTKEKIKSRVLYTFFTAPVIQAAFQSDIGTLLEQVGTGKESLSFMKRRIRRLAAQWASAARRLDDKLRNHWREQKRVNMRHTNMHLHTLEDKSVGQENKSVLRFHLFKALWLQKTADDEPVKVLFSATKDFYFTVILETYSFAPNLM